MGVIVHYIRSSILLLSVAALSTSAGAQSGLGRATVWPGYPGSILIAPQQANLKAPALYRSVDDWDSIENPVGVVQICVRDLQRLRAKRIISESQPVAAASVENHKTRFVGGKVSVDAKVIGGQIGADYDQIVTLNTGTVQVYETNDDDISRTILKNVGAVCRQVIADHLRKRRWVFVAAKAIQAYDYDAVFERVANASASAQCGLFSWCHWASLKGEVTGRITNKDRASTSKTFVTVALVPAEMGDGQSITTADLEAFTAQTPRRRLARNARSASNERSGNAQARMIRNSAHEAMFASRWVN